MKKRTVEERLAGIGLHIRAHLDERLTLDHLAAIAELSPFHFHRLFRVAFGENLKAYIARHRLQRAAHELRNTARSVTEIGLRSGYESPSAFGRAFARAFDHSPSAYRAAADVETSIPRVSNPSGPQAPPHTVDFEPRPALALRHLGPYDEIARVMERLLEVAAKRELLAGASIVGLSYDSPDIEEHDALRFDACITLGPRGDVEGARADGLGDLVIPGGRHAVFRHRGPYQRIAHAFDLIVATYVLDERLELRDAPFVEIYLSDPACVAATDLECDLAIPIR